MKNVILSKFSRIYAVNPNQYCSEYIKRLLHLNSNEAVAVFILFHITLCLSREKLVILALLFHKLLMSSLFNELTVFKNDYL